MYKDDENGPKEVNLPGGFKGALWTIAGAAIANVAKNFNIGNFFGNGCGCGGGCNGCGGQGNATLTSALIAENAQLKSEKYSDNAAAEQANRLLQNYLKPYGDAIAAQQAENARLAQEMRDNEKIRCLEKDLMMKEVELARHEAKCCCEKSAIVTGFLQQRVDAITAVRVPNGVLCPGVPTVEVTHPTTTTTAAA